MNTIATTSPEVQAAEARLAAAPQRFVSARLRESILDGAIAEAERRQHAEDIEATSQAVRVALSIHDHLAAELASNRLTLLERITPLLAAPTLDAGTVAEALQGAQEAVRLARGEVPPVLDVAYTLELAAWHSLGGLPAN
ncbi:MAG TPA: hypothetical protein VNF26_01790, partial [Candidatus Baltobacterales bacterium]|nr:hypothetical protein [Candidatus Baltobacterales bacterium]